MPSIKAPTGIICFFFCLQSEVVMYNGIKTKQVNGEYWELIFSKDGRTKGTLMTVDVTEERK